MIYRVLGDLYRVVTLVYILPIKIHAIPHAICIYLSHIHKKFCLLFCISLSVLFIYCHITKHFKM